VKVRFIIDRIVIGHSGMPEINANKFEESLRLALMKAAPKLFNEHATDWLRRRSETRSRLDLSMPMVADSAQIGRSLGSVLSSGLMNQARLAKGRAE